MKIWTIATLGKNSDEFVGEDIYELMLMFTSFQPAETKFLRDRIEYRVNPIYLCNPPENCRYASLLVDPSFNKVAATTYQSLGQEPYHIKRSGVFQDEYDTVTVSVTGVSENNIRLDPQSQYSDVSYIESYTINSFIAWGKNCQYVLQKKRMCPLRTENNSLSFQERDVYQVELWIEGIAEKSLILQILKSSCPHPLQGYFIP